MGEKGEQNSYLPHHIGLSDDWAFYQAKNARATAWATEAGILANLPNAAEAGPLFCGGMTVFNPLAMYAKPTSRMGIVGIGGLGHMAVKFAAAYGCDVTAFTSSES